jgi:thiol reductant ABC exporter CydC subunit
MTAAAGQSSSALGLSRRAGPLPRRGLALAGAAGALSAACAVGLLATSGWLLARASQRPPVFDLAVAIGAVQAFALGRGITRYLQRLAVHDLSLATLARLRLWLYDTVEPLVPDGVAAGPAASAGPHTTAPGATGSLLAGFVADTEEVTEALARGTNAAIDLGASIVLGAAVAWLLAPAAGAALLAGAAGVIALPDLAARLGRSAARRSAGIRADLADAVVETVRSAPELLAFGRRDLVQERLDLVRRRAHSAARRQALSTGIARALATWTAGAGLIGVVLAGLAAHRADRLSGVMLTVLVLVSLAALEPGAALPAALAGRVSGNAAASRLGELAGLEPPAREPGADASPPPGSVGALLDRVEVVARGGWNGAVILHDLSLTVPPGRRVALTGPSGSGKSTTLHVLLHFLEASSGTASIGGIDVRRMTRAGMARHVAWLAEETHLFATTLADNLRLARPEATDAECAAALERVGLGDWHRSLTGGLGTVLGGGGRAVSAGERQRLGMARAVLSGAGLLLLDEPTAHLDPWSSSQVLTELLGAAGSRTVLVVSHEPDLGGHVDEVVTLDRGRVAARRPGTAAVPRAPGRFDPGAFPV